MREVEIVFNGIEPNESFARAVRIGSLTALEYEEAEGSICIELTNDPIIHATNRDYRGVDRPTDVLSFPSAEGEQLISLPDGHLGDIMISVETAALQAERIGHGLLRELAFLAIHGTLHVLGFDHILPEDEEVMTKEQRDILSVITEKHGGEL